MNKNDNVVGYDAQTGQPIYVNKGKIKKKKYWAIPLLIFFMGVLSKVIQLVFKFIFIDAGIPDTLNGILSLIFYLSMFMVIPSIIVAVVLSENRK